MEDDKLTVMFFHGVWDLKELTEEFLLSVTGTFIYAGLAQSAFTLRYLSSLL